MVLNEKERITMLMMRGYGDRKRSYSEVANLFNDTFPNHSPVHKATVQKTVKRFEETGGVKDRYRTGRPKTVMNDNKTLDVMQSFVEDPHTSSRRAAQVHDVSHSSILRVLNKNTFKPYKIHLLQELSEDDYDRRLEFAEIMMDKIATDGNFVNNICFSDEATFTLCGNVNRHNLRYWSDVNPHWMRENHTQTPQKLNVWSGIVGTQLIGPFFIEGNLTSDKYEILLRNEIVPTLRNLFGVNFNQLWFQQDGAPAHFGVNVRRYLDAIFPGRWIGRRGRIEWPPRSPDFNPKDYFYWGHLKTRVYKTKPASLAELRQRIIDESRLISRESWRNVIDAFYHRLGYCQINNGAHFEHLIK